jgi:hypothetical protein
MASPEPQGLWFVQTWICTKKGSYSIKSELFWLRGSWEDFLMTPPHFCIFVIISLLKRIWPLICKILNFLYGWFLPSLIEISLLDLEKKNFKNV